MIKWFLLGLILLYTKKGLNTFDYNSEEQEFFSFHLSAIHLFSVCKHFPENYKLDVIEKVGSWMDMDDYSYGYAEIADERIT